MQQRLILSATVLLLRDNPTGLEVFMVVRHHKIDSFSGALVFPGGKVDKHDNHPELAAYCQHGTVLDTGQRAVRVAAIREAFEECGILLARQADSSQLLGAERLATLEPYRQQLLDNRINMLELCRQEQLQLALDQLEYYAHWITPKQRPKIFDTHFFLAPAPANQLASHDGYESSDSMWITPQQAVAAAESGHLTVVFPTRMNLNKLARVNTVAEALRNAAASEIVTVQPEIAVGKDANGNILQIPAAADYGVSRVWIPKDGKQFKILG